MPIYIALLRGINVGGNKRIKMDQLRKSFEALGLDQVATYIQSGNVVFKGGKVSPSSLSKKIEDRILADFGHSVSVILRTADEMKQTIANNPFLKDRGIDLTKLHVMFLSNAPASAALEKLETMTVKPDRSCCLGKEIYLYLPNGTSQSTLMKTPLDRVLSAVTTTRNWNTTNQLLQMCADCL
jgi:uncharacterized protein (DUF1697 family)